MNGTGDLAGRGSEIDQLDAMVSALTAGRGGMVWVEGEPGIGKSALLRAVRARARGCQTYLAVGDEFTRRLPLRALLDCLDPRLEHDLVAGACGGNPLYLREVVDALVRERLLRVGAGVAELVDEVDPDACSWTGALAARLDFLSAPTNRAVRVAALLGTPFSLSDLAVVAALPATTLVP